MSFWGYEIPSEVLITFACIFGVLITCSITFYFLARWKSSKLFKELVVRTNSWWYMAVGIAIVCMAPQIIGTILIAFVAFVALREMLSIGIFREADRSALFAAYFAIPVQFYLAHNNYYPQFLYFIPLFMFIILPFIMVMTGRIEMIGRSMALVPTILLQTVYMISHVALLYNLGENNAAGPGGLIIFLIACTAFNDVFQFTWGKLLGKRKILPKVSPNKTWAGFIGGVLSTAGLGYVLTFLTPMEPWQGALSGFCIGIVGFVGDALVSAMKRDLKVKDMDDLIPGHGGSMDRLDSIIITAPIFYHLLRYFIL